MSIKVEGGECAMEGSPSMLGELVYNLLDNAVKYNRENGSVVALLEENADGSRSLTVSDSGVGIDPADQEHVFERFFRGDRSRSSEGGTGLGLSIVKHAALAHGAEGVSYQQGRQGHQRPRGFSRVRPHIVRPPHPRGGLFRACGGGAGVV